MTLHRKLSWGLGFLFAIIFGLVFCCAFFVEQLAADSDNILKDNYASVVYAKRLASDFDALHSITLAKVAGGTPDAAGFAQAKADFEKNLSLELQNLTEANEKEYVEQLALDYGGFLRLSGGLAPGPVGEAPPSSQLAPTQARIRKSIDNILDVNLQAILRKNQLAKERAKSIAQYMLALGGVFLVLALGYFWYFPVYVSTALAYLATS